MVFRVHRVSLAFDQRSRCRPGRPARRLAFCRLLFESSRRATRTDPGWKFAMTPLYPAQPRYKLSSSVAALALIDFQFRSCRRLTFGAFSWSRLQQVSFQEREFSRFRAPFEQADGDIKPLIRIWTFVDSKAVGIDSDWISRFNAALGRFLAFILPRKTVGDETHTPEIPMSMDALASLIWVSKSSATWPDAITPICLGVWSTMNFVSSRRSSAR